MEMHKSKMHKSSRHSKITGNFGEHLTLYWLSRRAFECAHLDHTGIDIIARRPKSNEVLGISVKTRSRNPGKEKDAVNIGNENDFKKIETACEAFDCSPYFSIVVDRGKTIYMYILSKDAFNELYPRGKNKNTVRQWKMTDSAIERYRKNRKIDKVELKWSE